MAHSWQFEAIGTQWQIDLDEHVEPAKLTGLRTQLAARIEQFDRDYSRFRSDSLISRMAGQAGRYQLPPDAEPLLDLYLRLYGLSGGAVTPLIGQVLSDAGYDANYSLTPGRLQAPPAWSDVLDYDFPTLTLHRPALLDLGAAGKGYLVDLVAAIIEGYGVRAFCVDAGGDMLHRGHAPLRVALEHPADLSQAIGVAELADGSLCGSAGNRRAWGAYSHIMDPRTLQPAAHLQAVWVCAATTLLADALTTALYFMSPAALTGQFDFAYALMWPDASLEYSPNFPAEFFG